MVRAVTALRAGVVGVGWAGRQHLAAYSSRDDVEIVALAGMESERVAQLAGEYAIPATFACWEDMLENAELDMVSVATPTALHAPVAIAALDRGLHVLTEKPIAATVADAERMVAAARRDGRVLEVVFNHRLRGDLSAVAQIVASGEIGTPYVAKAGWLRRGGIPPDGSWFADKALSGGGPLIDLGVHVIDYAFHVLGEPRAITVSASAHNELGMLGHGGRTPGTVDVEDEALAFLRLDTGVTLTIEAAWDVYRPAGDEFWMTVYGTAGGVDLRVVDYRTERLTVFRDGEGVPDDREVEPGPDGGHHAVVSAFVDVVRAGPTAWTDHDGTLGLDRARIVEACYRSAAAGREVVLADAYAH